MKRYPKIRAIYASNGDADDDSLPPIKDKDDLRRLVGLGIVHVLDTAKAGHAYVGFEMGCTWDEEHGLGADAQGPGHRNRRGRRRVRLRSGPQRRRQADWRAAPQTAVTATGPQRAPRPFMHALTTFSRSAAYL